MTAAQRIVQRIEQLAECTDDPGLLTRLSYSPAMQRAHELAREWMDAAGLSVRVDAVGNLVGRREGSTPGAPALLLGSHVDTVRDAGRFDGALGFLLALACAEERTALPFAVEVLGFIDEEGVRFQGTYLGSRALAGTLGDRDLALTDADGLTLAEAITAFGGSPDAIASEKREADSLIGFVEAHIEQGPVLESIQQPVGVVSAIAGQTRVQVAFRGTAGHAGTVPMSLRKDALCAAAELTLAAEKLARDTEGLVATVGILQSNPGASNVIPGHAELTLDIRHQTDAVRDYAVSALHDAAQAAGKMRGVECAWSVVQASAAVPCDPTLTDRLRAAIGANAITLFSGAGHDAAALAAVCPVAMLFIRCRGGISHHPEEFANEADIAVALEVLLRFVDDLATSYA